MSTLKKSKNKKRLVILDAFAILHRAYHALPDFSSNKGEPTGALYGLSSMLLSIIKDLNPDYMVACYDLPKKTYRHEAFEDYKAGRKEAEDDLKFQIERAKDVLEAFNTPIYSAPGFEADDIIGTIVEQLKDNKDIEIIIASGDMDTLQLVSNKKVQVYTLRKGIKDTVVYDEDAVKDRFGFGSDLIPDYKGLRGDPSDNIPGIAGIGEKTATTLIKTFGSVEDIYKALKKNEEAFGEKEGIKARTIKLLKEGEEDAEFSKMLATIRRDAPIVYSIPDKEWEESLDVEKIIDLFTDLGFRALKARVKQMFGKEEVFETQGIFDEPKDEENVPEDELKEASVALWLLRSNITDPKLSDILEYARTKDFKEARKKILSDIKKQDLTEVFEKIEKPLIPVVEKMNKTGVKIDVKELKDLSKKYHKKLDSIEKKIFKETGEEFNLNSPKQLGEVLFEKMELSPKGRIKKTSTGQYSTRESELEKMKDIHSVISLILEYREFQKLLSTYIDSLPPQVGKDGRLRAEFVQSGTTTGRMASRNPNLQNIPIKSELGRHIRDAFIAEDGFVLAAFDHSQIELRIAAFVSGDQKLIKTFKEGEDIHTAVASEVFNVSKKDVTKEMRRKAKVINFGILYGMGSNALKTNLDTTKKEAQEYLEEYFKKFKGLSEFIEKTKQEAARKGYTETIFGRKRFFEGIKSSLPYIRAQAERMAVNAPIQGTSADFIKLAMVRIDEYIKGKKLEKDVRLVLQVHDELIYEIKKDKVNKIAPDIKDIMENVADEKDTKGVPIIAGAEVGENWGKMKSL